MLQLMNIIFLRFQSMCALETGLSDFHLMMLTVMQKIFKKLVPKIIPYRSYKPFSREAFWAFLLNELK